MPSITIELTDTELKSMEYAALSPQDWADNAVTNRARIAGDEIVAALVAHCNANEIAIATGKDAQIAQAFELGVVQTASERRAEESEQMPISKIENSSIEDTSIHGARNLIINGAAEVYQRGVSATAHNSYSVDRWQLKNTSGATCTHQQVTDSPAPFKNSVRYSAGGTSCTAAQVAGIAQRMEGTYTLPLGWGTSAAKPCTLSFWVKSSVTGTYAVSTRNNDTDTSFVNTYTINSANTWEHKTVTFSAQTAGTWLNTTGIGVRLWFDLGSGDNFNADATGQWRSSANYLTVSNQADVVGTSGATGYVTGVQLEVGSATPFEHRSFADELARCRRFFCKTYNYSDAIGTIGSGYWTWTKTTSQRWNIPLYQGHGMRGTPTIVAYNATTGTSGQYRNASNGTNHTVGTFEATENTLHIDENAGNWNNLGGGKVGRMFVTADSEL